MEFYFLARVVLHDAWEPEDYNNLHLLMENIGYRKTVVDQIYNVGEEYNLPDGTYITLSDLTLQDLLEITKEAIEMLELRYEVIISGNGGIHWYGLSAVEPRTQTK